MSHLLGLFNSTSHNRHCCRPHAFFNISCVLTLFIIFWVGYTVPSLANQPANIQANKRLATHSVETRSPPGWAKGRLLIMPRAGLPQKALKKVLKPYGAQTADHLKALNVHIGKLPPGADEKEIMHALKKDYRLKNVELDRIVTINQTITDPLVDNSWALPKIKAPAAWDISTGEGIIVAILDTGVDGNHPDLAINMVPGWNLVDDNADTSDVHGHGTWVAGTVAAAANNNEGSAGVAWAADIMPVRIADANGSAYVSTIANGIVWAADNGAKVVNNSFSGVAGSSIIQSAGQYLRNKGGVVVVSAGNSGSFLNFAPSNNLLAAAATNINDRRPYWSSYGHFVDIAAPGVDIFTTGKDGSYGFVSGTSFASPIVAATAALMLSANNELTPADLDQLILSTAVDLGASGFDIFYGAGRVDSAAAVAAASMAISLDDEAPTITITSPTGGDVSGIVPIDVNASDNVGITRVELFVNNQKMITDTQAPFAFAWDSSDVADGDYTLTAHAFDAAGNQAVSPTVVVTVKNNTAIDDEAPTITITSPTGGEEVAGHVPIDVNTADNIAVVKVNLFVDGQKILSSDQHPFAFSWDTTPLTNGEYTLTAHAYDEAGNKGVSPAIGVTVNNAPATDSTEPEITHFNLTDGMSVSLIQHINVSATDDVGIAQISLKIDGKVVAVNNSNSLNYYWNTFKQRTSGDTTHTVAAEAADHAGNTTNKTVTVHTGF